MADAGVDRDRELAAREVEAVRVKRLGEDARRPMSVNLTESIALSHKLLKLARAPRR